MPFPYADLRQKLVNHLIALEAVDPTYAVWALDQYRTDPSGLYRTLLQDVKAERARRGSAASPCDADRSGPCLTEPSTTRPRSSPTTRTA